MLDDMIQNKTVTYDDDTFTYSDICAKWENECFQNDILNLDQLMDEVCDFFFLNPFKEKENANDKCLNCFFVFV